MRRDEENIGFDLNNKEDGFRYYRIIVKILSKDKVHHQNIEIYTNGLKRLLELRRLHSVLFAAPETEKFPAIIQSN